MTTAVIAKTKMAVATMTATMIPMMSVVLLDGDEAAIYTILALRDVLIWANAI